MKHGVAFRKFSRTSSHRMLMLRNLVTSLIEHEQIKTTLPKAKDTARLAEKIITLGKKGDLPAARRAQSFLLNPTLVPKLFGLLAHRYSSRPGGYTRIHRFGNRQGDNAPYAILELVDNPRDLKMDITARAVGWELLSKDSSRTGQPAMNITSRDVEAVVRSGKRATTGTGASKSRSSLPLRQFTLNNLQKVLRFRGSSGVKELSKKTEEYMAEVIAKPIAEVGAQRFAADEAQQDDLLATYDSMAKRRAHAGVRGPATGRSALSISSGSLHRRRLGGLGLPELP